MEAIIQQPLVSIAVISYNSEKYILETLESVKVQTYNNIELVISDDCSTDKTLELCQQWIEKNKWRFVDIHIVQSPINTGQSGNYNRAFDACTGEWIKEIDGDDRLLPNCITDFIQYTKEHPEAKYIFGKMTFIGENSDALKEFKKWLDYSFFFMPQNDQLHQLIHERNCVPSPSSFYNRGYILGLGVRCDERIPYIEDYPKWINLLQKKVHFFFLDKLVVEYRIDSGISTRSRPSAVFYESNLLFDIYYRWSEWIAENQNDGVKRIVKKQVDVYRQLLLYEKQIHSLMSSNEYRIGKMIKKRFNKISNIIIKIGNYRKNRKQ